MSGRELSLSKVFFVVVVAVAALVGVSVYEYASHRYDVVVGVIFGVLGGLLSGLLVGGFGVVVAGIAQAISQRHARQPR